MLPKRYFSEAIVLHRRNYSEADRVIALFTKDYGRLTVLAKGVRKLSSRKRGSLEIFSYLKFSAVRGKGFDIMTESQLLEPYSDIRQNMPKVAVAYYMMETVRRLTEEEVPLPGYFGFVLNAMTKLQHTSKLRSFRKEFIRGSLVELGFWPKGKELDDPDGELEGIVEREMTTKRVGKKML